MRLLRPVADRIALAITPVSGPTRTSAGLATRPSSRTAAWPSSPRRARCSPPRSTTSRRLGGCAARRAPSRRLVRRRRRGRKHTVERIAVAHINSDEVALVAELERRWPPQETDPIGTYAVLRSGTPELAPAIPEEMLARTAPTTTSISRSSATSPSARTCACRCGGGTAFSARSPSSRPSPSVATRRPTSRSRRSWRAGRQSRSRTRCSTGRSRSVRGPRGCLDAVGDGVFLIDSRGTIVLWNPPAEAITGLAAAGVRRPGAAEAVPGWAAIAPRVPRRLGGRSRAAQPRRFRSSRRPRALALDLRRRLCRTARSTHSAT